MGQDTQIVKAEVVDHASEIGRLRELNRHLNDELTIVQGENDQLKERLAKGDAPTAALRKALTPFYRALQAFFDGADTVAGDQVAPEAGKMSPKWESWCQNLPGPPANIIRALLVHADASVPQLAALCKHDKKTIYRAIAKLNGAGLLNKSNKRYSLRQL